MSTSKTKKTDFLEEARLILRGEETNAGRAQLVQPSYALSHLSTNPVSPEVWALTIITLEGDGNDVPLVEPYLQNNDHQVRQTASNCVYVLQEKHPYRGSGRLGDGKYDKNKGRKRENGE